MNVWRLKHHIELLFGEFLKDLFYDYRAQGLIQMLPMALAFSNQQCQNSPMKQRFYRLTLKGLKHLSDTLTSFNESFASWLYVMNMNALTVDWPQAPHDGSFMLAEKRAEQNAIAAMEAIQAQAVAKSIQPSLTVDETLNETGDPEATFTANSANSSAPAKAITKKVVKGKKPKLTAKEKKERAYAIQVLCVSRLIFYKMELERIITFLPLEFRGSDPTLRRNMEAVIEGIGDTESQTVKLPDLIKADLNQARANKCLIALVNRKIVTKDSSTGTVLYHWQGVA